MVMDYPVEVGLSPSLSYGVIRKSNYSITITNPQNTEN